MNNKEKNVLNKNSTVKRINHFSDSTLAYLGNEYYVYTLSNKQGEVFYVGKGIGNRVFEHELVSEFYDDKTLNKKIKIIKELCDRVERRIITFGLSENEAFAVENALINFLGLSNLTNKVSGHGKRGDTVENIERKYGFEPMSIDAIKTNSLILAVKIKDAFNLSTDENTEFDHINGIKDDNNLKSRTLGQWKISDKNIEEIKYVIGINTSAKNSVVSAYRVDGYKKNELNGRFVFYSKASSINTLKKLDLYKKSLPDLKFGSGAAIAYINKTV